MLRRVFLRQTCFLILCAEDAKARFFDSWMLFGIVEKIRWAENVEDNFSGLEPVF